MNSNQTPVNSRERSPSAEPPATSQPFLSVIIPVRNEARSLPGLLSALLEQDYPAAAFEIIVADGGSTDDTPAVVRQYAAASATPVRLVENPGVRSGAGRNAGLRAAAGEFIVFIDGHCNLPSRSLLSDTVRLFQETEAECLCRPQPLLAPPSHPFGDSVAAVRASALGHGRDSLIYSLEKAGFVDPATSGASYRRHVFDVIGSYDERFDACEDMELNTRLRKSGMRAYTDPRLAVYYEPRATLSSLAKQMIRYGRGRVRLMRKHPDCISAAQLAPSVLLVMVVLPLILLWTPMAPWMRLLISAPALLYAAIVLIASLGLARNGRPRLLYQAPAIFAVIHLALGLGLFIEAAASLKSLWARQPMMAAVKP
jgi:succinoglycan biosynthesis protein ExoA